MIRDFMNYGHIYTAKHDYNFDLSLKRANEISDYDLNHHICLNDENGCYIVIQKTPRITGDVYVLTKLFCPPQHRKKGFISKLLDKAPRPLVKSPEHLEGIRL